MKQLLLIALMTVSAAASAQSLERMTWFNEPSKWTIKDGRLTTYIKGNIRSFLENFDISQEDKEKIAHGNAERLLKLK